jgi:CopG family nickel-responsive transcriptional regulator
MIFRCLPLFSIFMERFTISLDDPLAHEFDQMIARNGYGSRSEAVRDLIRQALEAQQAPRYASPYSVAVVSYVYNHHEKALAERLMSAQHEHHDLVTSTMHAHLDHDHCLEAVFLQGRTSAVQRFAQQSIAQSGVRHGAINLIAAETEGGRHRHGDAPGQLHSHLRPKR